MKHTIKWHEINLEELRRALKAESKRLNREWLFLEKGYTYLEHYERQINTAIKNNTEEFEI